GVYIRDTAEIFDHVALDEDTVAEQARAVLEDLSVQVIKVGFCGSPETLSTIAEIASDYGDVPVVAYMPNLSWWEDEQIDNYLDAFRELMLPQTTLLVGNHNTLWRWLLPDWSSEKPPSARDIARAAADKGAPYTLVTGISTPDQFMDNVLATPNSVLLSERLERFDAVFSGAGDTLSAALAGLLAAGTDLQLATTEALTYLDHSLDSGFRPGMGHVIPDRLFWAPQDEDAESSDEASPPATAEDFSLPRHETKH
ncbi:MAG: hydroxymethylpyrimidine/phosphomethylpyrimidine kinase, partial [Limnohabitans sp.]|nr:hydroxymethylpyrimidine/phosphomethylpyrimidine kinase [Limnohabitans sp.]